MCGKEYIDGTALRALGALGALDAVDALRWVRCDGVFWCWEGLVLRPSCEGRLCKLTLHQFFEF